MLEVAYVHQPRHLETIMLAAIELREDDFPDTRMLVRYRDKSTGMELDLFFPSLHVGVELDGYEPHGRNIYQAEEESYARRWFEVDRQKIRLFADSGIWVIPFAGSEVKRDANGCVSTILSVIAFRNNSGVDRKRIEQLEKDIAIYQERLNKVNTLVASFNGKVVGHEAR